MQWMGQKKNYTLSLKLNKKNEKIKKLKTQNKNGEIGFRDRYFILVEISERIFLPLNVDAKIQNWKFTNISNFVNVKFPFFSTIYFTKLKEICITIGSGQNIFRLRYLCNKVSHCWYLNQNIFRFFGHSKLIIKKNGPLLHWLIFLCVIFILHCSEEEDWVYWNFTIYEGVMLVEVPQKQLLWKYTLT